MKRSLFLFLICFFALSIQAQNKMPAKKRTSKDCIMMEDGKMMTMMDSKTVAMDKDMTLVNGTTVMTHGTMKMKGGKTMMMKDGDCVYMDGKMRRAKMKKAMMDKKTGM